MSNEFEDLASAYLTDRARFVPESTVWCDRNHCSGKLMEFYRDSQNGRTVVRWFDGRRDGDRKYRIRYYGPDDWRGPIFALCPRCGNAKMRLWAARRTVDDG